MKRVKSTINSVVLIIMIILSAFNVIMAKFDYVYRPKNFNLFCLVYIILSAVIAVFSIVYKKSASRLSAESASVLPIIALIYLVTCLYFMDMSMPYSLLAYETAFATTMGFSLVLFFVYSSKEWLKIIVGVLSFFIGVLFAFVVLVTIIFTDFGKTETVQKLTSPNDTYVASVMKHDAGATGGATSVSVYNLESEISLLLGDLLPDEKRIWQGTWMDEPVLKWQDDNTISINGKNYDVD